MAVIRRTSEFTYIFLESRDHTLDDNETLCPLDNGQQPRSPSSRLGALERLPLEIMSMILIQLEIRSLTDFRRVSQRAKQAVDSIPQYKKIILHAPASIRGTLSIGTGNLFSCQKLYETLCTGECESCGDFGGYLYLITCRRVCFLCFTEKPEYLPLLQTDATQKFRLRHGDTANLPSMRSVPSRYSPRKIKCRTRLTLIDHDATRQFGITMHGTIGAMEQYASEITSEEMEQYHTRKSRHMKDCAILRQPRSEDAFDGHSSNPRRFMAIVRAPLLDARTGSPEWGFHCAACGPHHYDRPFHWHRMFTMKSFEDHIREIQYIENETTAYQWIDGHNISPRFLGHLTEDGRVIGFLMERITKARHAGPQDLESCQQTLSQLHCLGVQHGDTNRFNFLIRNAKAILIDFDSARKCDNYDALLGEFENLPGCLQDPSNRGGGGLL
ncbi:hypothetical protein AJ80_09434 [Polytolypa hystricis UAMH7299]|uniref:F-box domain-containing protein n=1 Tax=Polytolypa hystricis (strain UAMH7299) TaxID=1447883 RepID=A0A2B7WQX7_POLH7|nr:hypothetical protein AJ80_09434 [Polytolypa hystricis UAMH7299]